ncbi:MAG: glycoside hydrolase family 47 protein [Ignavibacteriales bacterium]|nr:MAG: glycoside hydrolase family 47 protein [Ignavibacteriales bacterium]
MKLFTKTLSLSLILSIFAIISGYAQTENKEFSREQRIKLAEDVKSEFLHAWNGYKQYAWGNDALKPLSNTSHNWYEESLLMTPVDAFDTMVLMGLTEEANETKELIFSKLSFDKNFYVQNFEITIRLLGGLLSAYQLDGDERFLKLAEDLGNRLLPVFNSPTGMPYGSVNLTTGETRWQVSNPAEIGTLMIEFGTLSKFTGNQVFYDKAKKGMVEMYNRRSKIGLVGTQIDVEKGEWTNKESHISGMIDSYYEYLYKCWLLFGDKDFKDMYDVSIAAVNKYLSDTTDTGLWYGTSDMETGERKSTRFGSLDAFFPAVLAISGDLNRAEWLQESCLSMWKLHDIEPEMLNYKTMEVLHPNYYLRPEITESAFYLYQLTGKEKYLSMGKYFWENLKKHCRTESGYAALKSVITKEKNDSMESFFLAETLKYFYLLFHPDKIIDLKEYVFNTEAHPIKVFSE